MPVSPPPKSQISDDSHSKFEMELNNQNKTKKNVMEVYHLGHKPKEIYNFTSQPQPIFRWMGK